MITITWQKEQGMGTTGTCMALSKSCFLGFLINKYGKNKNLTVKVIENTHALNK